MPTPLDRNLAVLHLIIETFEQYMTHAQFCEIIATTNY
jgi:hypothetical protein